MAAKNLPPNLMIKITHPDSKKNGDAILLESVEQVIAFTCQDEALKGFKVAFASATDEACVCLEKDTLRILAVPAAIWTNANLLKKVSNPSGAPDTIVLMLTTNASSIDLLAPLLSNPDALPTWMNSAPIQTATLPTTGASWRATISNIQNLHNFFAKATKSDEDLRSDSENIKAVMSISRELNGERDIPKLLNLILLKAREVCHADAGSIYTIESAIDGSSGSNYQKKEDDILHFRFTQNHSVKQNLSEFKLPINRNSIVGNAVLNRQTINIPDLYKLSPEAEKNPFQIHHDRTWDQRIAYQSRSMLTLPMFDISHQVIGVIQLINCKKDASKRLLTPADFTQEVFPFDEKSIQYVEIVAQQAGIALENARMTEDIQKLFDGLVDASVTAIEQRDPTTSGHSHRVSALTVELARVVDLTDTGKYGATTFNEDQMREIRYASLLHDFGKLGVREAVLVKGNKLYPQDLALIQERFNLVRASYEIDYLNALVTIIQRPDMQALGMTPDQILAERDQHNRMLDEFMTFIQRANQPTVLEQGGFDRLKDIANIHFKDINNNERSLLQDHEVKSLSVSRGSLTAEEFAEIQSHVVHTYEFLRKIPWGKKLANVPQIAAKHHEKLDGSGYPTSAVAEQIPVQSRMMTIADIYDALSASDRPYKKALPPEKSLEILEMEVKGGKLDADLFRLFVESKAYMVAHHGGSITAQKKTS